MTPRSGVSSRLSYYLYRLSLAFLICFMPLLTFCFMIGTAATLYMVWQYEILSCEILLRLFKRRACNNKSVYGFRGSLIMWCVVIILSLLCGTWWAWAARCFRLGYVDVLSVNVLVCDPHIFINRYLLYDLLLGMLEIKPCFTLLAYTSKPAPSSARVDINKKDWLFFSNN